MKSATMVLSGNANVIGLPVLIVVFVVIPMVAPLQCFSCNSIFNDCARPSTCTGTTCSNISYVWGGTLSRGCESTADVEQQGRCRTVTVSNASVYACTCSGTDYCNGRTSTGALQQHQDQTSPGATSTVCPRWVMCYRCNSDTDDCGRPSTCIGTSCSSRVADINGRSATVRECETVRYPDSCSDIVWRGSNTRLCSCNTDYCNSAADVFRSPGFGSVTPIILSAAIAFVAAS